MQVDQLKPNMQAHQLNLKPNYDEMYADILTNEYDIVLVRQYLHLPLNFIRNT